MMQQEFENLTGIKVSATEYAIIEQMYYEFDGYKRDFCNDFVKKNKLIDVLREMVEGYEGTTMTLEAQLKAEQDHFKTYSENMNRKVDRLEKELEQEQEWKPWTSEKAVSQENYDDLSSCQGSAMTDAEAIEWISAEFGFAANKIRINRKMHKYEINRHHHLRVVGEIDRSPCYEATDWYYVFFTVCGMEYEAYNGSLIQL